MVDEALREYLAHLEHDNADARLTALLDRVAARAQLDDDAATRFAYVELDAMRREGAES